MIRLDEHEIELLEGRAFESLKLKLRLECLRQVDLAKSIAAKMEPIPGLRSTIIKSGRFAVLYGVFSGIISWLIFNWILSSGLAHDLMSGVGFSERWIGAVREWVPFLVALAGCGQSTALPIVGEANEDRVHLTTRAQNAHVRTMILGSMLEAVDDLLPDALPLRDDYEHNYDDDQPSPFVKRILAQQG